MFGGFGRLLSGRGFVVAGGLAVALILYLAFAVFGVHTLFVDREVNEEFPAAGIETTEEMAGSTTEATEEAMDDTASSPANGRDGGEGTTETGETAAVRVSAGSFRDAEYEGTGEAVVYRQPDGSYVLRLENLDVENGPDLFVYAVAADDVGSELNAEFLDLGPLKGNQGDQTYSLPPDFDPAEYRAVSIWCKQFSANFVTAPLLEA